ncbi:MAG TPA: beta galactosidase jelly roll domain-containing protein [Bacteroidales bacterium]
MKSLLSKNTKRTLFISLIICLLSLSGKALVSEENLVRLQGLEGKWQFSIGMNEEWTSPKFNDSSWESIRVPSPWEDEGYNGYNGYAFYRKKITVSSKYKDRMLYLNMGYIDDVDEVYFNGNKIGSTGSFPPNYSTAYNAERIYYIPEEYINFDSSNQIAVKVYDSEQQGGIVSGDIGLYGGRISVNLDVNLQSAWKFQPGDDPRRKETDFDDSGWSEIFVPGKWEDQGYRDYDGYAWYRKSFVFKTTNGTEKMVLLMGKIDDIDQVYINGTFVGSTGTFPSRRGDNESTGQEWQAFRGYYIPDGLLKKDQKNIISVRVLDTGGEGGIYEGPVGLITQTKYIEYWRKIKKEGNE